MSWAPHAFSLELRKLMSYRVDFWVQLGGTILAELVMAYFLWRAMFEARGVTELGGFSFRGMMLYYLLVPLVARLIRGDESHSISDDIYDGGLTRYLVYPLSFLQYKYVSQLVFFLVTSMQLGLALVIFAVALGLPAEVRLSPSSIALGFSVSLAATLLYFLMGACVELIAFWQDSVWSLLGMLRMTTILLGGGLIPLSFFPRPAAAALQWLPFQCLISLPIRCFLGQADALEAVRGLALIALWCAVFSAIASGIWRRGTRQYSGVGL